MILAIDCGNTNTVFALYTTNKQIKQLAIWRINNDSKRTADLYYPWLLKMFEVKVNKSKTSTRKEPGLLYESEQTTVQ